jgi:methylated-DNA-[protein]-cysteine S-methyltransferase
MHRVIERILEYAAGDPVEFRDIPLPAATGGPFQQRVLAACRDVAYGQTRTYADLALAAGSPRAARAVGNVMSANRLPLLIPCHRVVGSGGRLGGFSAPRGVALKRELLAMEARATRQTTRVLA